MSFEEVAIGVIKKSIRSAVCIDDRFAAAYTSDDELDNEGKPLDKVAPKELYNSFREKGNCDLDIYSFKTLDESWKTEYMLENKDLMILDWELDIGGRFDSTLEILKDVIESNRIPFVLIYTNTTDINNVANNLIGHFNPTNNDFLEAFFLEVNGIFSRFSGNGDLIDAELFFDQIASLLLEYIIHFDRREIIFEEIVTKLKEEFSIEDRFHGFMGRRLLQACPNLSITKDPFLDLSMAILNNNSGNSINEFLRIEIEPLAFKIDGTSVIIYEKRDGSNGIEAENLFNEFANAIINNPHNFLTLLSLEFKDRLREDFSIIGTDFSQIDERAFFHHLTNYRDGEEGDFDEKYIYDFILKSWINELHQQKMNVKSEVLSYIAERYKELKDKIIIDPDNKNDETLRELVRYAAFISTSKIENRIDATLRFGDIFVNADKPEEFFLCITPACDCLRPEEKIKNNFYFVRGYECDNNEALEKAESGYVSFLNFKNQVKSVEWRCKPFTTHISENNINSLPFSYCGENLRLEHTALLKENYTQRISNNSFGYGYRVGIDLPHIQKISDSEE